MKSKFQSGMQGVYSVAAELTFRGFIVSPTLRNAFGADLLATDQKCERTWSIQVKTNRQKASFWLVGEYAIRTKSPSHVYVFVTLKDRNQRPEFHVVPSEFVATHVYESKRPSSTWYSVERSDLSPHFEGWEVFGNPIVDEAEDVMQNPGQAALGSSGHRRILPGDSRT